MSRITAGVNLLEVLQSLLGDQTPTMLPQQDFKPEVFVETSNRKLCSDMGPVPNAEDGRCVEVLKSWG